VVVCIEIYLISALEQRVIAMQERCDRIQHNTQAYYEEIKASN
jgi:hypothetical protein